MPNWCDNRVSVRGRRADVDEFCRLVKSDTSAFDFYKVLPVPVALWDTEARARDRELAAQNITRFGAAHALDWCVINWGTQWSPDPTDIEIEWKRGGVVYAFDTAWQPAYGIYLSLVQRFPALRISWSYFEWGAGLSRPLTPRIAAEMIIDSIKCRCLSSPHPIPDPEAMIPKWAAAEVYACLEERAARHNSEAA